MPEVPTLHRICIDVLVKCRALLSDVGWIDTPSLRAIAKHCDADQLRRIEDETLYGSDRDLSWHTWDCWYRLYEQRFGIERCDKALLIPLPGDVPPEDYIAPPGIQAPTAHWRAMLERELEAERTKAEQVSNKLRNLYNNALNEKANRKVELCVIAPPKRRRIGGGSSGAAPPPIANAFHHADKGKMKMLHDIGVTKKLYAPVKSNKAPQRTFGSGPTFRPASVPHRSYAPSGGSYGSNSSYASSRQQQQQQQQQLQNYARSDPKSAGGLPSSDPFASMKATARPGQGPLAGQKRPAGGPLAGPGKAARPAAPAQPQPKPKNPLAAFKSTT